MEKNYHSYMDAAIEQAQAAFEANEVPVGAIVELNGQIIGRGHNNRESTNNPLGHAEIVAISKAAVFLNNWRLNECNIYVTVEPCPMCAGAIYQSRIKTLIFGCNDPLAGAAGSIYNIVQDKRLNHFTEVTGGIREEHCRELLNKFFSGHR